MLRAVHPRRPFRRFTQEQVSLDARSDARKTDVPQTPTADETAGRLRYWSMLLLATAAYIAAGKTGLMLAFAFPSASPIWPPTGIALALLLLGGIRYWPAIFIGAYVVNITTTGDLPTSVAIACGNTLEALAGAWLIRHWAGGSGTSHRIDIVMRFALCIFLASAVSASVGTASIWLRGLQSADALGPMWFTWWLGDVSGALVFTPLIVLLFQPQRPLWNKRKVAEALLFLAGIGFVTLVVFSDLILPKDTHYSLAYLCLIPVFWAAIRFGARETTGTVLLLSVIAIISTLKGIGPFAVAEPNTALILLQSFMSVASITGLIIVAAMEERWRSEEELERKVRERTQELEAARDQDRGNLQRLRSTIMHLPLAALLMDEHGNVLELNEAYCRTFSIDMPPDAAKQSPQILLEKFLKALLMPEEHMPKVNRVMETKRAYFGEEILLKDGRTIVRDFLPIFEEGIHRGQLFLYRDVTKERRTDKAKSEFMSLASHQLRTPLTTIRWALGRLEKELGAVMDDRQRQLLIEGHKATVRMAETIDTMLNITRIEAENAPPKSETFSLRALLREKEELFRNQLDVRRQQLIIDCAGDLTITTNTKFLKEILRNLLQNAIKYTPDGGSITIRARLAHTNVLIEVEDTGYGIPEHQQRYVFQKFFRGDNVVNRDTSGTGLGLYLVSLLAKALRGTIRMRSVEGQGTTFTLTLPHVGVPENPMPRVKSEEFAKAAV